MKRKKVTSLPESTFQLLDKYGEPAPDPQSVVAVEVRDPDGTTKILPFKWGILGQIGSAAGRELTRVLVPKE